MSANAMRWLGRACLAVPVGALASLVLFALWTAMASALTGDMTALMGLVGVTLGVLVVTGIVLVTNAESREDAERYERDMDELQAAVASGRLNPPPMRPASLATKGGDR